MVRKFGAAVLLTMAIAMPVRETAAQDAIGGAILGGAAGAIIGGAVTGRGSGAAIGAIVGATAGAAIAAEGERRRGGYYYYQRGCYLQRPDGAWVQVSPNYCGPVAYQPAPVVGGDAVDYCMRRFRSYDPVSGTYVGFDGIRRPCP